MERMNKEKKEKVMEMIQKAGDEQHETSWIGNDGKLSISKDKTEIKKGKKAKAKGISFELKVRRDLESKGRIVDKWSNNIDLETGELIIAKRKFNPFMKVLTMGTGFPDFISIKHVHSELYSVIGVEVKTNGILSKEEKMKCALYLKKKIFSKIWIAKEVKKDGKNEIEYDDFSERYGNKYDNS